MLTYIAVFKTYPDGRRERVEGPYANQDPWRNRASFLAHRLNAQRSDAQKRDGVWFEVEVTTEVPSKSKGKGAGGIKTGGKS